MKKKFPKDPKYTKIALYVLITVGALMIFWHLIISSNNLWISFSEVLSFLWDSIATIILGLVFGYILSPGVSFFQKVLSKIFKKKLSPKSKKRIRNISIGIMFILLSLIIVLMILFIFPPLIANIIQFSESLPEYFDKGIEWYDNNLKDSPLFTSEYTETIIKNSKTAFIEQINNIVLSIITSFATSMFSIFSSMFRFVLALIIAFYYLLTSADVKDGVAEFLKLRYGKKRTASIGEFLKSVDWVFGKYISAKLLQIIIIFSIAQVIFLALDVNLSTLMAVILALTNVIPYIGSFIGMIPPLIIALIDDPQKALWVFVSLMALQFVDGYIIQPFLIGDKMGLSPFWVIVVVLVGGNLFGITGILLSIPIAAVIRILIRKYLKAQRDKLEMETNIK